MAWRGYFEFFCQGGHKSSVGQNTHGDVMVDLHESHDAKEMALDALAELLVDFTEGGRRPHIKLLDEGTHEFALQLSEIKPVLALAIQTLRADADITLAEFARRLGEKSHQGPSQHEQGRSEPSFSKFDKMLEALGYDYVITITKRALKAGNFAPEPTASSTTKARTSVGQGRASKVTKKAASQKRA